MKRYSIRFQLLFWLIVPIIILLLLSIGSTSYLSTRFANSAFDDGLEDLTRTWAGRIQLQDGKFRINTSLISKQILDYDDVDKNYHLILGPHDEYIDGDTLLGKPPDTRQDLSFRTMLVHQEPVRVATIRLPFHTLQKSGFVTVQMAETFHGRDELKDQILISTLLHQCLLIFLAVGCVWLAVSRGLLPLENIRQAIANRSPNDFTTIDEGGIPEEVRPLISAINVLMRRMSETILMQRRFMANAAHQLRTPLAGLQTQTELLMREEIPDHLSPVLRQIEKGVAHSARLVKQLLVLARSEPNQLEVVRHETVDLADIAAQVAEAFVPMAETKRIDLGYEAPNVAVEVSGDQSSLYELVTNLTDNAITYTQSGGKVTIRVFALPRPTFVVEDNGPGIPAKERNNVFERFYRLRDTTLPGSGLGLSIAYEIAQAHQANIHITEGPDGIGTSIRVQF